MQGMMLHRATLECELIAETLAGSEPVYIPDFDYCSALAHQVLRHIIVLVCQGVVEGRVALMVLCVGFATPAQQCLDRLERTALASRVQGRVASVVHPIDQSTRLQYLVDLLVAAVSCLAKDALELNGHPIAHLDVSAPLRLPQGQTRKVGLRVLD